MTEDVAEGEGEVPGEAQEDPDASQVGGVEATGLMASSWRWCGR